MRLLRERDFRFLVTAYGLSALGDYLALIALTLRIHDLTGSGWAISGLLLTGLIPLVVFAPLAGLIVDRVESVRLISVTAAAQAAVALGLVWAESVPAILLLSFLLNTGWAVTQPAVFALTPRVVGEEGTSEANAYLEVARWSGSGLGPLLAGALTHTLGSDTALLANAATFVVVASLLPLLRARRPAEPDGGTAPLHEARQGFAFIRRDALLLLVVMVTAVMVVFGAVDNVAEVFFAKDVLRAGDVGYGALVTTWILGMVAGATLVARRLLPPALAPSVLVATVTGGAVLVIAVAWPSLPLALAAFFVGGGANGVHVVAMRSLIHRRVPDRLRGRVFAASSGLTSGGQIGAMALGGALVTALGARGTLLVGGLGMLAIGAVGFGAYGRVVGSRRATERRGPYSGMPS